MFSHRSRPIRLRGMDSIMTISPGGPVRGACSVLLFSSSILPMCLSSLPAVLGGAMCFTLSGSLPVVDAGGGTGAAGDGSGRPRLSRPISILPVPIIHLNNRPTHHCNPRSNPVIALVHLVPAPKRSHTQFSPPPSPDIVKCLKSRSSRLLFGLDCLFFFTIRQRLCTT